MGISGSRSAGGQCGDQRLPSYVANGMTTPSRRRTPTENGTDESAAAASAAVKSTSPMTVRIGLEYNALLTLPSSWCRGSGIDAQRQPGEHHLLERLVAPPHVLGRI